MQKPRNKTLHSIVKVLKQFEHPNDCENIKDFQMKNLMQKGVYLKNFIEYVLYEEIN